MKVYKISCLSKFGSYFGSYQKSVTVIAASKEDAVKLVKDCDLASSFIYPEKSWDIEELVAITGKLIIVDIDESSDY